MKTGLTATVACFSDDVFKNIVQIFLAFFSVEKRQLANCLKDNDKNCDEELLSSRVARFFLHPIYPNREKYTKLPQHYLVMAIKYTQWP
jgi:hypothetical protein